MLTWISNIIAIIKALWSLWNYLKEYQEQQRIIEAEKKRQARDKAIEDLKNAKTEEEIWDAQDRLVKNKP